MLLLELLQRLNSKSLRLAPCRSVTYGDSFGTILVHDKRNRLGGLIWLLLRENHRLA